MAYGAMIATTWSLISPLMTAMTTPTYSNKREKKKKRNE
jgi:hypothetical protein